MPCQTAQSLAGTELRDTVFSNSTISNSCLKWIWSQNLMGEGRGALYQLCFLLSSTLAGSLARISKTRAKQSGSPNTWPSPTYLWLWYKAKINYTVQNHQNLGVICHRSEHHLSRITQIQMSSSLFQSDCAGCWVVQETRVTTLKLTDSDHTHFSHMFVYMNCSAWRLFELLSYLGLYLWVNYICSSLR